MLACVSILSLIIPHEIKGANQFPGACAQHGDVSWWVNCCPRVKNFQPMWVSHASYIPSRMEPHATAYVSLSNPSTIGQLPMRQGTKVGTWLTPDLCDVCGHRSAGRFRGDGLCTHQHTRVSVGVFVSLTALIRTHTHTGPYTADPRVSKDTLRLLNSYIIRTPEHIQIHAHTLTRTHPHAKLMDCQHTSADSYVMVLVSVWTTGTSVVAGSPSVSSFFCSSFSFSSSAAFTSSVFCTQPQGKRVINTSNNQDNKLFL